MEYIRQTHVNTHAFLMYVRFDYNSTQSLINQKVYLTDAARLHRARVVGMQVASITTDWNQANAMANTTIAQFAITLIGKRGQIFLDKYPLGSLTQVATQGKVRRFDCVIDPTQSYVERFIVPGGESASDTIPILFSYRLK